MKIPKEIEIGNKVYKVKQQKWIMRKVAREQLEMTGHSMKSKKNVLGGTIDPRHGRRKTKGIIKLRTYYPKYIYGRKAVIQNKKDRKEKIENSFLHEIIHGCDLEVDTQLWKQYLGRIDKNLTKRFFKHIVLEISWFFKKPKIFRKTFKFFLKLERIITKRKRVIYREERAELLSKILCQIIKQI